MHLGCAVRGGTLLWWTARVEKVAAASARRSIASLQRLVLKLHIVLVGIGWGYKQLASELGSVLRQPSCGLHCPDDANGHTEDEPARNRCSLLSSSHSHLVS